MRRLSLFLVLLAVLCAVSVFGQMEEKKTAQAVTRRSLVFSADTTEYSFGNDSFVKSYFGHVRAIQQDVELRADVALYLSAVAEARFYGGAMFKDSLRTLNADTLIYFYNRREALAIGNVIVTEKDRLFKSGRVRYQKDLRLVEASGGVYVHDDSVRATVFGREAVFNDSTGYGAVMGSPVLTREDEAGSIITVTCSDTLEIDKERKVVHLWKNVMLRKDSLDVGSEYAQYDDKDETVILSGSPVARHVARYSPDDAVSEVRMLGTVTGDSMRVFLSNRKISSVDIIGTAHSATVSTDTTGAVYDESIIDCASMRLLMKDNFVSLVTAEGTASSYYHKTRQPGKQKFVNEAEGDTIYFYFDEGKVSQMRITGRGGAGARGKYYGYKVKPDSTAKDSMDTAH
ncbi:hypothetical protein LLG96_11820 [bacterium]|nr:hypothetical protein [bacterium]